MKQMALTAAAKAQIVKKFKQGKDDTGSPEVQIALLTARITGLTEHLKVFKKDFHTRFGLTNMVSKRRRLMRYLKNSDLSRYQKVVKELDIRG